jgi:hypothetical protein
MQGDENGSMTREEGAENGLMTRKEEEKKEEKYKTCGT